MSDAAMNPYQSNFEPTMPHKGSPKRPTGLLIFCVLILTFASMGFLGSLFGVVMLAVNGGKVDYKQQMGSQPNVDVNAEAMEKMQKLGPTHATRNTLISGSGLLVSLLLIIGCVAAIYPIRSGGLILTIACGAAILFLIAQGVVVMMTMQDILAVMKDYPDNFFIPKGNTDERAMEMAHMILRITYTVIPIVTWVFNAVKIVLYASLMGYLRKQNVRAFLSGAA